MATQKGGENLRRLRNTPVAIICARPAEAEQIAKAFGIEEENVLRGHEVAEIDQGHTFYCGHFSLRDGENLEYYVTHSTRQGIQSFTASISVLLHILHPRFVVHAGVCAGFRKTHSRQSIKNGFDDNANQPQGRHAGIHLTDVIFGEVAVNFEEGKFENIEGTGVVFFPDYNIVKVRAGDMQGFASSRNRATYHYGDYISGSAVRGDASIIFERMRSTFRRNAIALDMEASAFLELCDYFKTICLGVVKGVSDFGNAEKGSDPQIYDKALENTAKALSDWITHSIPAITWEEDFDKEPAAELVPGYYNNFIRHVLDNVLQGWDVSRKDNHSIKIPREEINGLKVVMPKDYNPRNYESLGLISDVTHRYRILEVDVGGKHRSRPLYFKSGYLIDFPRTLNKYASSYDAIHQAKAFEFLLKKKEYFSISSESMLAMICSWEDFVAWLENDKDVERQKLEESREHTSQDNVMPGRSTPA